MEKIVVVGFNGDMMCFMHAILNVLDYNDKGYDVTLVIEGAATKHIVALSDQKHPLHNHFVKLKEKNLIDGICKACANKMEVLEEAKELGLNLLDDMSGHPSFEQYTKKGYTIITL